MRVALVTQWFPPEAGSLVAAALADGLADRGHHVDVLTGFPNYPTGKLHPDYPMQRYRRDQRSPRVTVHRAPLYPSHDANAGRRMLSYGSFALSASVVARRHLPRPDVWLTYSSPATSALPALSAPARLQAPSYLLIQDLWPDSVTDSGFLPPTANRLVSATLGRVCAWSYRRSAGIGVISPSMRRILTERGVADDTIFDTPNWIGPENVPLVAPAPADLPAELGAQLVDGPTFMYAGNLGELQGLEPLIDAFALCPEVNLVLVGDGVALGNLRERAARRGAGNIHFAGSRPTERMPGLVAASDVQIVSLQDTPLLRASMPSKVQASLAAGRAVLAHAAGDVADVVEASRAGVATPPGDVAGVVATVRRLAELGTGELAEMGRRGRQYYDAHFSADAGLDRLEHMITRHDRTRSAQ